MRDFSIFFQLLYMATAYMNVKHGNPGRTLNPATYRAKFVMYVTQILAAICASAVLLMVQDNISGFLWALFACFSVYLASRHIKLKHLFFGERYDTGRIDNRIRFQKIYIEKKVKQLNKEIEEYNKTYNQKLPNIKK